MKVIKYAVAAATAGLLALGAALTDESVTVAEWVSVALAALGALGLLAKEPPRAPGE